MSAHRNTSVRYPGGFDSFWGILAFCCSYAIMYLWPGDVFQRATEQTFLEIRGAPTSVAEVLVMQDAVMPAWKEVGWIFYNAHFVQVSVPLEANQWTMTNLLRSAGGDLLILFLVPPLTLMAAGYLVTRGKTHVHDLRFDLGDSLGWRYWLNGGLMTAFGYLPLTFAVGILVHHNRLGPDLLFVWILAGMVYPFVFGGLGSYLNYVGIRRRGELETVAVSRW